MPSASANGSSPSSAREPVADLARLVRLGGDRREGAVELLGAARARERLQRVEAEAALVRLERGERRRAAHVRDPRARRDRRRDLRDRAVGDAEEDELRVVGAEVEPALAQARGDRRADASRADHVCSLDHLVAPVPLPDTGHAAVVIAQRPRRRSRFARTVGPLVVEHAVPGRVAALAAADEHVLAVDALELRRQRRHRAARALVARVGLQLDAEAAESLEGVLEHQQLRLDVRAGAPGRPG